VRTGVTPLRIPSVSEDELREQAGHAAVLLGRLQEATPDPDEIDLAAATVEVLEGEAAAADHLELVHVAAPYTSSGIGMAAALVVAPLPTETPEQAELRASLTADLAALVRSVAGRLRAQHAKGVATPAPALPGTVETWKRLRTNLPEQVRPAQSTAALDTLVADELIPALDDVLAALAEGELLADERIGLTHLPGGADAYRTWVRRETTLDLSPEEIHELGLEQCRLLAERLAEVRARLGGPPGDGEARAWVTGQPRIYAKTADEVAERYRAVMRRAAPLLPQLFHTLPKAPYDVKRLDPAGEAGMTFGYYQTPTTADPVGYYNFNGSGLEERSQLNAAALILHELAPGHHFHLARLAEDETLHPIRRYIHQTAFTEGWAEYASGLGWELGLYDDDWDAYGRLAHERFTAQRLVVDTAMNLGRWNLDQARDFMRANTLEGETMIGTETLRYSTDMPGQALAYRAGYLGFERAREAAGDADVRDVHEAMLGAGTLRRVDERVRELSAS
jgi:uncharacterized protein (DUF885 family)